MKYKSTLTEDVTSAYISRAKLYMKPADRNAFASAGKRAGLDGNKAYESVGAAINDIQMILDGLSLEVDYAITTAYYGADDGRGSYLIYTKAEHREIVNSMVIMTWHKRTETGNYEIVAYLS